jgi:hypothetical protein
MMRTPIGLPISLACGLGALLLGAPALAATVAIEVLNSGFGNFSSSEIHSADQNCGAVSGGAPGAIYCDNAPT